MDQRSDKTFLEHLEDLRWTIIKSVIALVIGMVACLVITKPIMHALTWPLERAGQDPKHFLKVLGVTDALSIQIEISTMGAVLLALPFILSFLGQFILPALTSKEKKFLLPVFFAGAILFFIGVSFCYFVVLPQTLKFFMQFNDYLGVTTEWTIQNYIGFVIQVLLAFGLSFELPLVIFILNLFGIVSHEFLKKYRRHAFIVILVGSAFLMPPDVFSMTTLAVPLYALYEICIWITWFHDRKKRKESPVEIESQEVLPYDENDHLPPSS